MKAVPTRIEKWSATEMLLVWNSGHSFVLPFAELRLNCPCAGCVDEHTGERMIRREAIPPEIRPLGVKPIGRYAIQIDWSDRHETGMYHFDRLVELCQKHGRRLA